MMNKVTTIDELRTMCNGEVVELPPFIQGQHFYARLKRPSMMKLASSGKIPNKLLRSANALFNGTVSRELEEDDDFMKDLFSTIDVLAESVFIEPSWKDLKEAGVELTDEQYMFIFNYTQKGVDQLEPFREDEPDTTVGKHVKNVQEETE